MHTVFYKGINVHSILYKGSNLHSVHSLSVTWSVLYKGSNLHSVQYMGSSGHVHYQQQQIHDDQNKKRKKEGQGRTSIVNASINTERFQPPTT